MRPVGVSRTLAAVGWTALLGGAAQYRSFASREVLDRWSLPYAAVLLALTAVALWAWRHALRGDSPGLGRTSFRLGIFFLGVGYLWAAGEEPQAAARLLELNLFGSASSGSALLQWLSLAFFFSSAATRIGEIPSRRWRQAAIVATAVGAALVFAEGAARVRVAVAPTTQGFPTYSQQAWLDRFAPLNNEGFRDDSLASDPPLEARRLLVLGDSVAFGFGLERLEQRFGEQLAAELTRRSGQPWESLTAAAPDTHTLDHIGFLERARPFRPDVIILLYALNDIDYLYEITQRAAAGALASRFSPIRIAFLNSYLFQEIYARVRALAWREERRRGSHGEPVPDELLTRHLADLQRLVASAEATACVVGVTLHGWLALGSPEIRRRFDRFYESADAISLPVWPMTAAFAGAKYEDLIMNRLDHHPNAYANRLAARATAELVVAALRSRECPEPSGDR